MTAVEIYAKLLSEENIRVIFDDTAETAKFNPHSREIIMPVFDWLSEASQQLFVSHEVGHALFTDLSSDEINRLFNKYGYIFNIVEDIFIEKQLIKKYLGLNQIFKSGYEDLYQNNFFYDIKNKNCDDFSFLDRLNLFFKVGINTVFSNEEKTFVVRAKFFLNTREDVLNLVEDIYQFEKKKVAKTNTDPKNSDNNSENNSHNTLAPNFNDKEDEYSKQEEQENTNKIQYNESTEETEDTESTNEDIIENVEEIENTEQEEIAKQPSSNNTNNETTNNEESNENEFGQYGNIDDTDNEENKEEFKKSETQSNFDNQLVSVNRTKQEFVSISTLENNIFIDYRLELNKLYNRMINLAGRTSKISVKKFKKDIQTCVNICKMNVQSCSTYFNMLKSAKNMTMAKKRKTGILDPRRLAHYKTSEKLFKSKALSIKESNHGIIILLDCSSSMNDVIETVAIQIASIAEFCYKNNIAFEIIAFGLRCHLWEIRMPEYNSTVKLADNTTWQLINFITFFYNIQKKNRIIPFSMSYTPFAQGLFVAYNSLVNFKNKGIDKTHLVVFTDGSPVNDNIMANNVNVINRDNINFYTNNNVITLEKIECDIRVDGHKLQANPTNCDGTNYFRRSVTRTYASLYNFVKTKLGTEITINCIGGFPEKFWMTNGIITEDEVNESTVVVKKTNNIYSDYIAFTNQTIRHAISTATAQAKNTQEVEKYNEMIKALKIFCKEFAKNVA